MTPNVFAVDWPALQLAARKASESSYSPYSHFAVGAAVVSADGRVFSGCNVENASYGLTICAERNAIFQAVAAGVREIRALVIYTPTPEPVTPCGACRQVLLEFGEDCAIACYCNGPRVGRMKASDSLPGRFTLPQR